MPALINKSLISLALVASIFAGCAANRSFEDANYQKNTLLDKHSCALIDNFNPKDDLVYNGSYYGLLARTCKDYKRSNEIFDMVEQDYKYEEDLEGNATKAARTIGAFLVNDTVNTYRSFDFERSMINIYKALNFLALNDFNSASAEINRALRRDDILGEKYSAMQSAANEKIAKESKTENAKNILAELNQKFAKYKLYKNNINPLGKYLRSLLYLLDNESAKASDLLRELVVEVGADNKLILDEYKLANSVANGKPRAKYIWLIYENGVSPQLTSYYTMSVDKLDYHFAGGGYLAANDAKTFDLATMKIARTVALPVMEDGFNSFDYLSLNGVKTTQVANMNAVMANELQKRLSTMVARIISQNTVKSLASLGAGYLGGIAGFALIDAYKRASQGVDTRVFVGLANSFDVARVVNRGHAIVRDDFNNILLDKKFDLNKDIIIYIKSRSYDNTVIYTYAR